LVLIVFIVYTFEMDTIAVWFSCGAASAVAAFKTIEKYGSSHDIRIVNNPVAEEDADNRRFLFDVEKWLGKKIEYAINPKYPSCSCVDVWADRKFMSGPIGAPCTMELKKKRDNNGKKTTRLTGMYLALLLTKKSARTFCINRTFKCIASVN
jgi:hypothetical protein